VQDERDEHLSRPDWLPPVGHFLCRADRIGDGEAEIFEFRRDWQRYEIFVLRHGEAFVAYHNDCPHTGGPLDWMGRFLTRDKTLIRCAGHGAKFRIENGLCIKGPCAGTSLAAVSIAVVAGDIVLADA
jgi:nitrite reductase/ring-hydroxylating ferredoxin subunit